MKFICDCNLIEVLQHLMYGDPCAQVHVLNFRTSDLDIPLILPQAVIWTTGL